MAMLFTLHQQEAIKRLSKFYWIKVPTSTPRAGIVAAHFKLHHLKAIKR